MGVALTTTLNATLLTSGHYKPKKNRLWSTYFQVVQQNPDKERLKISPLLVGGLGDIKPGVHQVYESSVHRDKFGNNMCYPGLAACVRIEIPDYPPIYIVDNHHMSYFAWHEALAMGYITMGAILVTIDRHADLSPPKQWSFANELLSVADYVKQELWIDNFILPAVAKSLFSQAWQFYAKPTMPESVFNAVRLCLETEGVRHRHNLSRFYTEPVRGLNRDAYTLQTIFDLVRSTENFVFDLDIDALVGEQGNLQTELSEDIIVRLAGVARQANIITIAISPAFAHRSKSLILVRRFINEVLENRRP